MTGVDVGYILHFIVTQSEANNRIHILKLGPESNHDDIFGLSLFLFFFWGLGGWVDSFFWELDQFSGKHVFFAVWPIHSENELDLVVNIKQTLFGPYTQNCLS